ncbi:hypothetical protein Aduo_013472 [Ancylostoma duodenale]
MTILSSIYRFAMNSSQQRNFEDVVRFFNRRLDFIPLELVLGFFCTQVFNRWTKQYQNIGFIDNLGLMTALYVRGRDQRARMYRRNIIRYCELIQVLVFRDGSLRVRRRFPTLDTVVAASFMMPHEKEIFESYSDKANTPKYWIPANWALAMTYQAWKNGHIENPHYKLTLQEEIKKWRTNLEWVFNYDWVPLPLMYPQVVCLAVHFYFLVCLFSRQTIITAHDLKDEMDTYIPVMTCLQFVFYMGWVKVIEGVLNPFGEDDDDFETNALIDRNITMGMMIVDQGYDRPPEVRRDSFWEEVQSLYSEETSRIRNNPPRGSVNHIKLSSSITEIKMMPHLWNSRKNAASFPMLRSRAESTNVKCQTSFREERDPPRMLQWMQPIIAEIRQMTKLLICFFLPWKHKHSKAINNNNVATEDIESPSPTVHEKYTE